MDELKIIGRIYTDFPEKFGIPRQSGLVDTFNTGPSFLSITISSSFTADIPMGLGRNGDLVANTPITAYIDDEERLWGVSYGGVNVRFKVAESCLRVCEVFFPLPGLSFRPSLSFSRKLFLPSFPPSQCPFMSGYIFLPPPDHSVICDILIL